MKENLYRDIMSQIIENIMETKYENFDNPTLSHAKNRILDTLGCLIGGARDDGNSELVNMIRDIGGKPESTIMIYKDKVPVHYAAMVNSILARSFDFEPVSPFVDDKSLPGHISGSTIMTALALAEMKNHGGRELITALLIGDDLAARLLVSGGFEFGKGWDTIGTVNALGATAIAGRLLGLDRKQLNNAFGIALNQLAGSMQMVWDATTSFKICQGLSSRNGIFSARLAKAGWTGPQNPLFGEFGYYKLYTDGCRDPEALTKDLGKKYYSDKTFKPYPCCRINHAAIDSALSVVNNNKNLRSEDIRKIEIAVTAFIGNHICAQPFEIGDFPHANAAFNLRFTVATAILRKCVKPEHFTKKAIHDPEIRELIKKVNITDMNSGNPESAGVTIVLKDGSMFTEFTNVAKGDPENPMSDGELIEKFWTNVNFNGEISKENAIKIIDTIKDIESLDHVRDLIHMFT